MLRVAENGNHFRTFQGQFYAGHTFVECYDLGLKRLALELTSVKSLGNIQI